MSWLKHGAVDNLLNVVSTDRVLGVNLHNPLTFTLTPARCVLHRRLVVAPCAHAAHQSQRPDWAFFRPLPSLPPLATQLASAPILLPTGNDFRLLLRVKSQGPVSLRGQTGGSNWCRSCGAPWKEPELMEMFRTTAAQMGAAAHSTDVARWSMLAERNHTER